MTEGTKVRTLTKTEATAWFRERGEAFGLSKEQIDGAIADRLKSGRYVVVEDEDGQRSLQLS